MSDFQFYSPMNFFEKADADDGKTRRIAGIISTETLDKQGEVLVQKGLDLKPWIKNGWFNDNHKKEATDVLGYPTNASFFQKGATLPDGKAAEENCTWAEGYLVDTPKANAFWELGRALQKSNDRRLGFSVEGKVQRRAGPGGKRVVKAVVNHVAITHCPVGEGTRLETLVKSLTGAQEHVEEDSFWNDDDYLKALTVGDASPGEQPVGPREGEGAAALLSPESMEKKPKVTTFEKEDDEDEDKKELSKSEAIAFIVERFPEATGEFAERALRTIQTMQDQGVL